jgi:transposase-like protein
MGASLVKLAGPMFPKLPYAARLLLTCMAVTAKDTDTPPRYFGGRDALVYWLYGYLDDEPDRRENQYRHVRRMLERLKKAGAIRPLNTAHTGAPAEFELILERPPKGGPLESSSENQEADPWSPPQADLPGPPTGGPPRSGKADLPGPPKEYEEPLSGVLQENPVVISESQTQVSNGSSSVSKSSSSTHLSRGPGSDGFGNEKQDQKRCKHHPCGVYESQHHRLAEFDIEPHNFTWWPDNDPKPDERKRSRRNYEPPWKCWRVLIQHRRIQHMSAPRKYDQEFRERAVRMYRERLAEPGESKRGARRHVGVLLDLNPETLRNWAEERDRVESGRSPAPRSAESEEVRALRRRVTELERANEILKTSAAFFAQAELDRRLR